MLNLQGITKSFGSHLVLNDLSLKLDAGEIGVLLGASGSGKTTLLRGIAGLEKLDSGHVQIAGIDIPLNASAASRGVGFLFQHFALFPHLTAAENIAVAIRKLKLQERKNRIEEILSFCGLSSEIKKYPHQLSGGQQQRLALARALAPRPKILLMDEPFSSLDPELRVRISQEVRSLLKSQNVTSLIVTHHISEAYDLADKIGILDQGNIIQWATPYNLYHLPDSPLVAQYLERVSFLPISIKKTKEIYLGSHQLSTGSKRLEGLGTSLKLLVRPDDIQHDDSSGIKAKVCSKYFRGSYFLYELELDGHRFFSHVPSHHNHAIGENIGIRFEIEHLIGFPIS